MTISERKTANAIGGKTARACDSCLSKRARFFCPADDAFLCQACDINIHSANQLASRHERICLKTSSNRFTHTTKINENSPPSWHHGFTRKARTPRNGKRGGQKKDEENMVPEMSSENSPELEEDHQLLYRVPVFDPFAAELCSSAANEAAMISDLDFLLNNEEDACDDLGNIPEFDADLAEFAADVETLLGEGLDNDENGEGEENLNNSKAIKVEIEDEEMRAVVACHLDPELDMGREVFKWDFDYEIGDEEKVVMGADSVTAESDKKKADLRSKLLLRLNHEAVMSAWPNQYSPWTDGIRPDFNPDDGWPDFLEIYHGGGVHQTFGENVRRVDGGREARVSRYREKRRTRLFSKKIRYEVRKLNAEKRPRLKGRFVKRTSFSTPGFPAYMMNKR